MTVGHTELIANWGERTIPFLLVREDRRSLRITVCPEGIVRAQVPFEASTDAVVERVSRRGGWIVRQLQRFDQWRPRTPSRQYVSGETHRLLGRQYRLLLRSDDAPGIQIEGDRIVLQVPCDSSFVKRRAIVRHWYSILAHRHFPSRLDNVLPAFERFDVAQPRLIIRPLMRRWGNFTPSGALTLNVELVQASPHLIDYVIAHELAHAVFPNHGPEWQGLLSDVMPDWRARKAELELQLL